MRASFLRINIVPSYELEDPLWHIPDLIAVFFFLALSYAGAELYLQEKYSQIAKIKSFNVKTSEQITKLKPDVEQVQSLDAKVLTLKNRLAAFTSITDAKLTHFHGIMAFDLLQLLKPEGVWITKMLSVNYNSKPPVAVIANTATALPLVLTCQAPGECKIRYVIEGYAADLAMFAEMISQLERTARMAEQYSDPRTRISFSKIEIVDTQSSNYEITLPDMIRGKLLKRQEYPKFVATFDSSEKLRDDALKALENKKKKENPEIKDKKS